MSKIKKSENKTEKPLWLKYSEQEIKEIILSIIGKNPSLTSEKIGLVLRDSYGIPTTRLYGIKISEILKEAGTYKNPELENLGKKAENLQAYLEKNKQDKKGKRALIITKAKLSKAKKYFGAN